jgi:alpha-tubulin suppressor-like RCC1 family protein
VFDFFCSFLQKVYACGAGQYGQLGTGITEDSDTPRVVDTLTSENIISIACGSNHSGAVSHLGVVYVWGNGANGRLGLQSVDITPRPTKVSAMRSALVQSGNVNTELLNELRGTNIPLHTTKTMLDRTKQVASRIKEKQTHGKTPDIQVEMDAVTSGLESAEDEQSMVNCSNNEIIFVYDFFY